MSEAMTTQEWLLEGAIPSQEFKKSHVNRIRDLLCSPLLVFDEVYVRVS